MSFDPHCKSLVNLRGNPVVLSAPLPNGGFLFCLTGKKAHIVTDADGKDPSTGRILVYDATKSLPHKAAAARVRVFNIGDRLIYVNTFRRPMTVTWAKVVAFGKKASLDLQLETGEKVRAIHTQVYADLAEFTAAATPFSEFIARSAQKPVTIRRSANAAQF